MCINGDGFTCVSRNNLTKRQKNWCNERLTVNRDIVSCALAAWIRNFSKPMKCLEGIGVCGTYGILWGRNFKEKVNVTIVGQHEDDYNLIRKNIILNKLNGKVFHEDACVHLRQNSYDFIFLNCKTYASKYLDSVFSKIEEGTLLIITTSEDPSLYWQAPELALRNYGGVIAKTSYNREVAARLVIAQMVRACTRYNKGIEILCVVGYKPHQSFTIIAKATKGINNANKCLQNVLKLAHCNICENRKFISNSCFLDKLNNDLDCECSKLSEGKVILGLGPLWAGEIFDVEFIKSMIECSKEFLWGNRVFSLLSLILEEARCVGKVPSEIEEQKESNENSKTIPYFYFNTHRLSPKELKLQKLHKIVKFLHNKGYRASRTHFDSEAIRTNAPLCEFVKILREH